MQAEVMKVRELKCKAYWLYNSTGRVSKRCNKNSSITPSYVNAKDQG